jgi:hypothetical protein
MTQPAFEIPKFSGIPFALKGAAQAFQPPIALSFPARRLFGGQAISGFSQGDLAFLKLR